MSFKQIKGHQDAIETLKGYLKNNQLCGSYLFIGPEGIGKKMVAREIAKVLNCTEDNLQACDSCSSCKRIEENQHPDIYFISAEESRDIKIEQVRNLQQRVSLRPYQAKKKVFIIDDAHNLNTQSANALLKILEEPPEDSVIILVSAKPALLFSTIISRCKIIKFYALQRENLREILNREYQLNLELAHFLAFFCEGRIGMALGLKDSGILRQKNLFIDEFVFSGKPVLESVGKINIDQARSCLNILASWFRDLYLLKSGISYEQVINLDRKNELLKIINRYSLFDLNDIINNISQTLMYLEKNINLRLLITNLKRDINQDTLYKGQAVSLR